MSELAAYLRAEAGRRFELGRADCATFAAGWLTLRLGHDPIAPERGYTEAEATAHVAGWGGLVRLAGRVMRRAGLRLTRTPEPGDVAVVAVGNAATCAIRTPRGWAMRWNDGLASLPAGRVRVLAAWSV